MACAAHAIEIHARRERDACLGERAPAEFNRIIGETRHIAIDVEGAVDWRELAKAEPRQGLEEEGAALRIARAHRFELFFRLEGRLCGDLRHKRRRDEEVLRQALYRP